MKCYLPIQIYLPQNHKILGNGTYDIRQCYEIVRIKREILLIPPKKEVIFENEVWLS
ncbi:hypothetical protein [Candidatus Enterovibrio altilux]|uniref:Mobile element protein n=1 Tax=Candidatus Enterovibrio altilux TaxID=1927128 RepID=A0A291BBX5_9GAMM|nr:hypothetical protein BTN50_2089 [Candidatus Enterovibrio luxaltus]